MVLSGAAGRGEADSTRQEVSDKNQVDASDPQTRPFKGDEPANLCKNSWGILRLHVCSGKCVPGVVASAGVTSAGQWFPMSLLGLHYKENLG